MATSDSKPDLHFDNKKDFKHEISCKKIVFKKTEILKGDFLQLEIVFKYKTIFGGSAEDSFSLSNNATEYSFDKGEIYTYDSHSFKSFADAKDKIELTVAPSIKGDFEFNIWADFE